jgi:hypothetical protein
MYWAIQKSKQVCDTFLQHKDNISKGK